MPRPFAIHPGEMNSFESRLDSLSKQLNEGIIMLMGRDTEKAERLARLEERLKP